MVTQSLNSTFMMQTPESCDKCPYMNTTNFVGDILVYKCQQFQDDDGDGKDISFSVKTLAKKTVDKPDWCPFNVTHQTKKTPHLIEFIPTHHRKNEAPKTELNMPQEKTYWEQRQEWKNISPRVKWTDIKVGETYLIPPLLNHKRRIVKVLSFYNNRLRIQVLNNPSNPYNDFLFIDDYDLEAKHFVKMHKLSNILLI